MQNVSILGLSNLIKTLQNTEDKLQDTQPLMLEIANHLHNIVLDSFESQSSPDGKAWTPIKSGKKKILYKSGHMQDTSLYFDASNNSAVVGFNSISNGFQYPLTHQFGTDKAGRNRNITIEARAFMPIKSDGSLYDGVEDELIAIVEEYIGL
jgi:phage virion morphogenesis protein